MERRDDATEVLSWKERTLANDIPTTFNDPRGGGVHHPVYLPNEAFETPKPVHYKA
jgi:dihydropyrimidine dehydrogenase (NAD+) subunit PreA